MDLIPKPNCKSNVWQYFGLIAGEGGKPLDPCNPICRLCRRIVHSKNGSTTNLRAHLRTRHRKMLATRPRGEYRSPVPVPVRFATHPSVASVFIHVLLTYGRTDR
ncbi:hypothetical protein N1851_024738 [Merluccius polli]|uniref:BED-type domain-containing protein n=1 Tax=Merluccius polli TaxID=89951 RepID=A0AA47MEN8_MERPO|nr:hypothetical protein N1851_024738 [Merluccius polli]